MAVRDLLIAACLGTAVPAVAQTPGPALHSAFPAGARAGETIELEIAGERLDPADSLWFDTPGIRGFRLKSGRFRVAVGPFVPVGVHEVRVLGRSGVSNPRIFLVGERTEVNEVEPNDSSATANPLPVGSVANGRLAASPDVDSFRFEAKRGDRIVLELAAGSIDSKLDAGLRLFSPSGRDLVGPSQATGNDPSADLVLPEDGAYVVQVHDVVYSGSADHVYRLTIRDGPHLRGIWPVTSPIGHEVPLILRDGTSDRPQGPIWMRDAPISERVGWPSALAGRLGMEYRLGPSNPVFVAGSTEPVVAESEPNGSPGEAQTVQPPVEVSARFHGPGDRDVYRFAVHKGDILVIEAEAEVLGSPADPSFVVRRAGATKPVNLASGDDSPDPFGGQRFPVGSLDARARFVAPEDGDYLVQVTDKFGSNRTDLVLGYRLRIRPERPDFTLFVVPNDASTPSGTDLPAGGRVLARALVHRRDGLSGPIRIEAIDLPPGVSCEPVIAGPDRTETPLVLSAERSAPTGVGTIRFLGTALSGDRKEVLDPSPNRRYRKEIQREAIPGVLVWPTPKTAGDGPPIARARVSSGFVLAVVPAAPFALTAHPSLTVLGPGDSAEWTVEIERRDGFAEPVQVAAIDLPPGIPPPPPLTIPGDKNSGTLKMTVPKGHKPDLSTFVLTGSASFHPPDAKPDVKIPIVAPSNGLLLSIHP